MHNSDPYGQLSSPDTEGLLASPDDCLAARSGSSNWDVEDKFQLLPDITPTHGLEALSAAASGDHFLPNSEILPPEQGMLRCQVSLGRSASPQPRPSPDSQPLSITAPLVSPLASMPASNNINFILNPLSSEMSPPIDPSLLSPSLQRASPSYTSVPTFNRDRTYGLRPEASLDDHEVSFLLRHFSEAPGQW